MLRFLSRIFAFGKTPHIEGVNTTSVEAVNVYTLDKTERRGLKVALLVFHTISNFSNWIIQCAAFYRIVQMQH